MNERMVYAYRILGKLKQDILLAGGAAGDSDVLAWLAHEVANLKERLKKLESEIETKR